ncbi:MAG: hypothetical protein ACD_46C00360G0003 [uncultured bacterium]|nr:MAG: hypothetical protein ACD_46C00360G0003 [uncultured bacterium]
MHELRYIQEQLQKYLLHAENDIEQYIVETKKVSTQARLAIYANAYFSRLLDALADNYPVLQKHIGEEEFAKLGHDYINRYPSTYRSIRWFGDYLSYFIQENSRYVDFPHLAELAQFEWTMTLVFDAAEDAILQLTDMQNISPQQWPNMKFRIHPSVHILTLSWNVVAIWQAILDDQIPGGPLQTMPVSWVLWRKELVNQFYSLSEDEAWAMDAMLKGLTFAEICEGLSQWTNVEATPLRAASLLKSWISAGMIADVVLK